MIQEQFLSSLPYYEQLNIRVEPIDSRFVRLGMKYTCTTKPSNNAL